MEKTALINPWLETISNIEDQPYPSDIDDVETADFFEEVGEEMMVENHNRCYRHQGSKAPFCSGERMGLWFVGLLLLTFAGGIALLSCSYRKQCLGLGSKGEQSSASEALEEGTTFAPTASIMVITIQQDTPSPAPRTVISSLNPTPSATKFPTRDTPIPVVERTVQPQPKTSSPTSFKSRVSPEVPAASPMPTPSASLSFVTPATEVPTHSTELPSHRPTTTIQALATLFPTPAMSVVMPETSSTTQPSSLLPTPSVSARAVATEGPTGMDLEQALSTLVPASATSSETNRIQQPLPSSLTPTASLVGQDTAAPALIDLEQVQDLVTHVPTSSAIASSVNRIQPQLSMAPTPSITTNEPATETPALVARGQPQTPDPTTMMTSTPTSSEVVSKTDTTKRSSSSAPTSSPTLRPTTSQPSFSPSTHAPTVSPTTGSKSSKNNQKTESPTSHPSPSLAGADPRTLIPTAEPILAFIPLVAAPTLNPTSFNDPVVLAVPTSIPKGIARLEATPVPSAATAVDLPASSAAATPTVQSTTARGRLISFPFLAEHYHGDTLMSSETVDYPAHYQAFGVPGDAAITLRYTSKVHVVNAPVPLVIELWHGWEAVDVWVDNELHDDGRLLEVGSHAVLIECRGQPGQGIEFNAAIFWERPLYTMDEAETEIRTLLDEHAARDGEAVRVVTVQIAGSDDPYLETVVDATSYDTSGRKVFLILVTLGSVNWVVEGSSVIGVAFSHQPASKVHGVDWTLPILELQYVEDLTVWETIAAGKTPDESIELAFLTDKVVL